MTQVIDITFGSSNFSADEMMVRLIWRLHCLLWQLQPTSSYLNLNQLKLKKFSSTVILATFQVFMLQTRKAASEVTPLSVFLSFHKAEFIEWNFLR